MRNDFLDFLKAISVFSLVTGALLFTASVGLPDGDINRVSWFIFIYFIFITLVFHGGLLRASLGKPQVFIRYYMGATTFKLFIHVIVLIFYSLFNRNDAVQFIITFLVLYSLFTFFETVYAVKKFRK